MTRSQDAVAQSQTLAAQKSGRQQHDMQGPHVHEDAQAMEQIMEEEKIFISSVPLIPDRICSTRNLKAPDGIPNIIYTGQCGARGALHRHNRTSIVGVGTIGR